METIENITVKQFIENYLIRDIALVKKDYPYFAFLLMAVGFEFLGKCQSEDDWNHQNPQYYFENGFQLTELAERYRDLDLYHNLRCGLVHSLLIKDRISLSDKGNDSLSDSIISCDEFYEHFKSACEKVLNGEVEIRKDLNSTFFPVSTINSSSVTGSTQTNIVAHR